MITDFLLDHSALVPGTLVAIAAACLAVGYAALRHRPRVLAGLVAVAAIPVLALTLTPNGKGGPEHPCTVQFSLPTPGSVELLANVALLLPLALFATLATRRPLLVLAAGSGLSALIECLQALAPAIGRACDTNDWAMNTLGAAAGVLLAWCALRAVDRTGGRVRHRSTADRSPADR